MSTTTARTPHRLLGSMLAAATAAMMCAALSGGTALAGTAGSARLTTARHHHAPADADHDGLPNKWERAHHTHVHQRDAKADPDHDGLNNLGEFHGHTLPHSDDTDHDGLEDGAEVHKFHTNPCKHDSDHDGIPDGEDDANHDHVADEGEDGNFEGFVGTIVSFDAGTGQLTFESSIGIPLTVIVNDDTNVRACGSCWTDDTQLLLQEGQDINGLMFEGSSEHGGHGEHRSHSGLPVLRWLAVSCPPD
jgi:Bacterial TSP3 repeat